MSGKRALALKAKASQLGSFYEWMRRIKAYVRFRRKIPHDPDFAAFALLPGDGLMLDVGASIGQSALSFRLYNETSPIISFEPQPAHRRDLEFVERVIDGFEFELVGAGSRTETRILFVPRIDHYRLPAESSLDPGDARSVVDRLSSQGFGPDRLSVEEIEVHLKRLDELELAPEFIKIDVEGAETEVLLGLEETIVAHLPNLMIERSENHPRAVTFLEGFGYRASVYEPAHRRFVPFEGQDCVNLFFLKPAGRGPAEDQLQTPS